MCTGPVVGSRTRSLKPNQQRRIPRGPPIRCLVTTEAVADAGSNTYSRSDREEHWWHVCVCVCESHIVAKMLGVCAWVLFEVVARSRAVDVARPVYECVARDIFGTGQPRESIYIYAFYMRSELCEFVPAIYYYYATALMLLLLLRVMVHLCSVFFCVCFFWSAKKATEASTACGHSKGLLYTYWFFFIKWFS